jgi:hypothetical protein
VTDREAFKAAFLERAAQAGWTAQELADRAEGLAGELEKTALLQEVVNGVSGLVNAGTNLASTLGSWAIPVGVAAPLVAGAALGALAGGLGGGGLAALLGYKTRQADNEGLVELMKRLPPNATVRDLLSDPVYNQDTAALPADAARLAATFRGIRQGLGPPPPADY